VSIEAGQTLSITIDRPQLLAGQDEFLCLLDTLHTGHYRPLTDYDVETSNHLDSAVAVFDTGLRVPEETADPRILPTAPLYDHQRYAAAWLARTEDKVVNSHAPLAHGTFYSRGRYHAGISGLGEDLLAGKWPVDAPRPTFDIFARGVIIGCEVSVGKTHSVCAFLLGCEPPSLLSVPRVEPGKIAYTTALDFGNSAEGTAMKRTLTRGLIATRAAFVLVNNTIITSWLQAIRSLVPDARIVTLTDKREHEACTYGDIAHADIVLVTRQFLTAGSPYRALANAGRIDQNVTLLHGIALIEAGRGSGVDFFGQMAAFDREHRANPDLIRASMRCPLLHLFAWPRLVVDEIHELQCVGAHIPEFPMHLSARFVIGISATMQSRLATDVRNNAHMEHLFSWFLGLGVRINGFPKLAGVLRSSKTYQHDEPESARNNTMCITALARWTAPVRGVGVGPLERGKDLTPVANQIAETAAKAIYWRNTQTNVNRQCPIAEAVVKRIPVPVTPLQRLYKKLHSWSTSRVCDVPILVPISLTDATAAPEPASYATTPLATGPLTEYPQRFGAMVRAFLDEVSGEAREMRLKKARNILDEDKARELEATAARLENGVNALRGFEEAVTAHFAPHIEQCIFIDEVERMYGTKVCLLFRYLDAIHAAYPQAHSIVAVGYVKALATIFEHLHLKVRGRPYVTLGGKNVATTKKELARYNAGGARVALVNTNAAASGMNLQVTSYVFHLDERTPKETRLQLNARAARSQRVNKVVVFDFVAC